MLHLMPLSPTTCARTSELKYMSLKPTVPKRSISATARRMAGSTSSSVILASKGKTISKSQRCRGRFSA